MNYHGRKVDAKRVLGWAKTLAKGRWVHDVVDARRDRQVCGISLTRTENMWEGYRQGKGYLVSQPTKHCILRKAFKGVEIKPTDKLLDMGCGKGRIFAFIIRHKMMPLENVSGFDINPDALEINRSWTKRYPEIKVLEADALSFDYSGYSLFYLGNSFHKPLFQKVVERLEETVDREIRLIYVFDDWIFDFLKGRKGWTMTKRERFYRIHGLPACPATRHYSHWTYEPSFHKEKL